MVLSDRGFGSEVNSTATGRHRSVGAYMRSYSGKPRFREAEKAELSIDPKGRQVYSVRIEVQKTDTVLPNRRGQGPSGLLHNESIFTSHQ
jgi:hypothetical protein